MSKSYIRPLCHHASFKLYSSTNCTKKSLFDYIKLRPKSGTRRGGATFDWWILDTTLESTITVTPRRLEYQVFDRLRKSISSSNVVVHGFLDREALPLSPHLQEFHWCRTFDVSARSTTHMYGGQMLNAQMENACIVTPIYCRLSTLTSSAK
jgi:hypothetical protein